MNSWVVVGDIDKHEEITKSARVLMAKELTAHASYKEAYGNRFHMSALDHF